MIHEKVECFLQVVACRIDGVLDSRSEVIVIEEICSSCSDTIQLNNIKSECVIEFALHAQKEVMLIDGITGVHEAIFINRDNLIISFVGRFNKYPSIF